MMTCYMRMRTWKCDVNFLEKFQEDLRSYKLVWWANEWGQAFEIKTIQDY